VRSDIFGFGSTMYEIMTGSSPYEELYDEEVASLFLDKRFPSVTGIFCGDLIMRCWREEAETAREIYDALR
jgi:hypothetical protein